MNMMNDILRDATLKALDALHYLSDAGATVTSISVRGGRPVITLDTPPPSFVRGVLYKSYRQGDRRECVLVAMVRGCRVEWHVHTVISGALQERA